MIKINTDFYLDLDWQVRFVSSLNDNSVSECSYTFSCIMRSTWPSLLSLLLISPSILFLTQVSLVLFHSCLQCSWYSGIWGQGFQRTIWGNEGYSGSGLHGGPPEFAGRRWRVGDRRRASSRTLQPRYDKKSKQIAVRSKNRVRPIPVCVMNVMERWRYKILF